MQTFLDALMVVGLLTAVVGCSWVHYRFMKRLERGPFSSEALFWPLYYNRREWLHLLAFLSAGVALCFLAGNLGGKLP